MESNGEQARSIASTDDFAQRSGDHGGAERRPNQYRAPQARKGHLGKVEKFRLLGEA